MLTDEGQWQTLTMNNQQQCCTTNDDNMWSTQTSLKDQMNPSWRMASGDGSIAVWVGDQELLHAQIPRKGYGGSIEHNVSCRCWGSFSILMWNSLFNIFDYLFTKCKTQFSPCVTLLLGKYHELKTKYIGDVNMYKQFYTSVLNNIHMYRQWCQTIEKHMYV